MILNRQCLPYFWRNMISTEWTMKNQNLINTYHTFLTIAQQHEIMRNFEQPPS